MPKNRKLFIHGDVHFITTRVVEGLPIVSSSFMKIILESIIARAQQLYDIKLGDFLFMSNHLHLLITVTNPCHVDAFMGYLKTESAHAINRLMGKRKGSVWEDGYDSPIILDIEKLKDKIVYIYTNPQSANLVETIDQYPNLSSWQAFKTDQSEFKTYRIIRTQYRRLVKGASDRQKSAYAKELREDSLGEISYKLDLKAAFNAFSNDDTYDEFRKEIIDLIKEKEEELKVQRKKDRKQVLGASALKSQSMYKAHTPKKFGKKMICLGSTKEIRKDFIEIFKQLRDECIQAYRKIVAGCRITQLPPGFYMPGRVKYAEALPGSLI